MPVVEPDAEGPVQDALTRGHEARLLEGHVVGHRAHSAREDVLPKAQDGHGQLLVPELELLQKVAVLESLLEVALCRPSQPRRGGGANKSERGGH